MRSLLIFALPAVVGVYLAESVLCATGADAAEQSAVTSTTTTTTTIPLAPGPVTLWVRPTSISLGLVQGDARSYRIELTATKEVKGLASVPPLLARKDQQYVLPETAFAVDVDPFPKELKPGTPTRVGISFDLKDSQPGQYDGTWELLHDGSRTPILVSISLKAPRWIAVVTLVFGLVAGISLSAYRSLGLARDLLVVGVDNVRTAMIQDPNLPAAFKKAIENQLQKAERGLRAAQWDQAQKDLQLAQDVWSVWQADRETWIELFRHAQALLDACEALRQRVDVPVVARLVRDVGDAMQDAPSSSTRAFRDRLDDLGVRLKECTSIQDAIEVIRRSNAGTAAALTLEFQKMPTTASLSDLVALKEKASQQPSAPSGVMQLAAHATGIGSPPSVGWRPSAAARAHARVRVYRLLSYVFVLGLLLAVGLKELYEANPTFGSNGWSDYFALVAWGFGAEATRASITATVKGWGVAGLG